MTGTRPPGPLAYRLLPERVFYGWYLAVACSVLMFVGVGVGYYGLAVFLGPLQTDRGFSGTQVSAATGLFFALSGLTGAVVGPAVDRRGPRAFIVTGTLVLSAGVALLGQVRSAPQLFAVYAVLAVGFGVSTSVSVQSLMTRWFVAQRAKATSISSTGISVGGVVLSPVCNVLVERHGLGVATLALAVLVAVVAVPVTLAVVVTDPADLGLEPDGGRVAPVGRGLAAEAQRRRWTRREAMGTVQLWSLVGAFAIVLANQTGFVIHQVSFLEQRLGSRSAATFALSTTALGSIVARLAVGQVADRLDIRRVALALFWLQAAATIGTYLVSGTVATYALVLAFGFTIGNVYMVQSLLVGEVFGAVSFGTVFGIVALTSQVTSGVGPLLVGWLRDVGGGYALPFTVTSAATFGAGLVVLLARPLPAPEVVPEPAG